MAACDNIYGNLKRWEELYTFLENNKSEYLKYMREKPHVLNGDVRICYVADIQKWLLENFKSDWLKEQLEDNFEVQRIILGKAHHE